LSTNAVELSLDEASRILEAIAPTAADGAATPAAEIGGEQISDDDLQHLQQTLTDAPPVATDHANSNEEGNPIAKS
jgi:hypothetical protein